MRTNRKLLKTGIMKRINSIILILLFVFGMPSCDDDWKNKDAPMNNIAHYERVSFTDYSSFPAESFPAINEYFSPNNPAAGYLESWLNSTHFSVDVGSTANVEYDFMDYDRDDSLNQLSQRLLIMEPKDYKLAWGTPFVEAFTPSKPALTEIPKILKANIPNPEENPYKVVQYNYSSVEPTIEYNKEVVYYKEDFNRFSATGTWGNFDIPGIFKKNLESHGRIWQIYNRSSRVAMLGYLRNGRGGNIWFITYELDLSAAVNPVFQFDLGVGYYQDGIDYLNVKVTDEFDSLDPNNSAWKDLTNIMGVKDVPNVTGYPSTFKTLTADLAEYAGKKIYIAFQCVLPIQETNYTLSALYVIDDIKLSETRDVASIPSSEVVYKTFKYDNNNWSELTSVYTLQIADYEYLGLNVMNLEQAREKIPLLLAQRITNPKAGQELVVSYKQSEIQCYAENYIYNDGKWAYEKMPDLIKKIDKFEYKSLDEKWKYAE